MQVHRFSTRAGSQEGGGCSCVPLQWQCYFANPQRGGGGGWHRVMKLLQRCQASHAPREVGPDGGLAAVAGHASSWRGGGIDLHPFVCRTLGNGSGSSPCLPLESEMVVTTCTHPWNLCGPPISIWRKKLLRYPSPLAPLNSGPLCFWRTQASSWAPSVVVFYLVAPSDCLHTANSSSVLWAWPPKPKPQYTSSTCPSGWLDKHFRLWGSGLSWLCPLHICCWAFLWSSIPPSLFQLISSVRGLPSVQKPFPLWQLPPRGKGPVRIPFFIFSFLLPCPVMQRFSCSFGSLSSGIVQ